MIGGLFKSSSRVAMIAAAGLLSGGVAAQAADLGGNCCADLEERVAELEATTARKGNTKVSLEVSGHVHEALVYYDVSGTGSTVTDESGFNIGTHNSSRSRFRFKGSATISADWSAGFLMELGIRANHLGSVDQSNYLDTRGLDVRHEALWIKSKTLGTVWLGWTSSAADGITEICLGCSLGQTADWSSVLSGYDGTTRAFALNGSPGFAFNGDGDRREVIKYVSPTIAGFSFSAAAGPEQFGDVALRYAGEFGAFRVAAGVGYQWELTDTRANQASSTQNLNGTPFLISQTNCNGINADNDCEILGASASIMHSPSGVYVAGAYGHTENNKLAAGVSNDSESFFITAGINSKWNSLGKTNLWAGYWYAENNMGAVADHGELEQFGLGINQKIDAAAMDLYVHWRHVEAERNNVDEGEADFVTAGAIIRF